MKIIMERYHNYRFVSNVEGTDGVVRILCVWKEEEMEATSLVVDHNWVGVSFRRLANEKVFVVFGVYLLPRFGERLQSLYKLEALVSRVEGPVMLIGDFNAMLNSRNNSGSAPLLASYLSFSRFVYACRLKEVEDSNKRFTWSNHRQRQDLVQCKLDWCMVNNDWKTGFGGEGRLNVQTSTASDHSVLLYQSKDINDDTWGQKPFRFFKPWLMDKEGKVVMLQAWRGLARGCPMMRLNITTLQSRLEECREHMEQGVEGAIDEEHRVRKQLSQALLMEEVMWKQRSRIRWLAEGDKNTSFFHEMAKSRQAKLKIRSIEYDGTEYVQSRQILEVCTTYFRRVLDTDEVQGMLLRVQIVYL
ncbi:uncharacterized protein LOC116265264 [Nymphaea colorata]|uniref:uncharacterized protein LOC116265264 n=1 Tax=Nymphaea colorata TaxID=210225 RepID=UPI00129D42BA|nr:uncharacterized protein LOC116265264 [Nymphaea colorata]